MWERVAYPFLLDTFTMEMIFRIFLKKTVSSLLNFALKDAEISFTVIIIFVGNSSALWNENIYAFWHFSEPSFLIRSILLFREHSGGVIIDAMLLLFFLQLGYGCSPEQILLKCLVLN